MKIGNVTRMNTFKSSKIVDVHIDFDFEDERDNENKENESYPYVAIYYDINDDNTFKYQDVSYCEYGCSTDKKVFTKEEELEFIRVADKFIKEQIKNNTIWKDF